MPDRPVLVVLCVCLGVVLASEGGKVDQQTSKSVNGMTRAVGEVMFPISGRVFHADFVKDFGIAGSSGTRKFRQLGFHVENKRRRTKRDEEAGLKKHIYSGSSGFVGSLGKKDLLVDGKSMVEKIMVAPKIHRTEKRHKRDLDVVRKTVSNTKFSTEVDRHHHNEPRTTGEVNLISTTEQIVAEDNKPQIKNNDTDKTLFVHDAKPHGEEVLDTVELGKNTIMRKTVVDDTMKLYPVYRGVNHHYLRTQRRLLQYSNLDDETHISSTGNNLESRTHSQGRSRRPLKKLALPLLLALKLKTALLLPVILGLVALIALKGLWAGLTGLGIASALGLKALLAGATKVVVQPPPPPSPPHIHHFPPHEVEYWNRNDFTDYHPNSWT